MTEFRWLVTLEKLPGTFEEPCVLGDGREAWIRLQHRPAGMVNGSNDWLNIPTVSEVPDPPRITLVAGAGRGH